MSHQPNVIPASIPCPVRQLLLYPALHRDPHNKRVIEPYTIEVVMVPLMEVQAVISARMQLHCKRLAPALRHRMPLSTHLSLVDR